MGSHLKDISLDASDDILQMTDIYLMSRDTRALIWFASSCALILVLFHPWMFDELCFSGLVLSPWIICLFIPCCIFAKSCWLHSCISPLIPPCLLIIDYDFYDFLLFDAANGYWSPLWIMNMILGFPQMMSQVQNLCHASIASMLQCCVIWIKSFIAIFSCFFFFFFVIQVYAKKFWKTFLFHNCIYAKGHTHVKFLFIVHERGWTKTNLLHVKKPKGVNEITSLETLLPETWSWLYELFRAYCRQATLWQAKKFTNA